MVKQSSEVTTFRVRALFDNCNRFELKNLSEGQVTDKPSQMCWTCLSLNRFSSGTGWVADQTSPWNLCVTTRSILMLLLVTPPTWLGSKVFRYNDSFCVTRVLESWLSSFPESCCAGYTGIPSRRGRNIPCPELVALCWKGKIRCGLVDLYSLLVSCRSNTLFS